MLDKTFHKKKQKSTFNIMNHEFSTFFFKLDIDLIYFLFNNNCLFL